MELKVWGEDSKQFLGIGATYHSLWQETKHVVAKVPMHSHVQGHCVSALIYASSINPISDLGEVPMDGKPNNGFVSSLHGIGVVERA